MARRRKSPPAPRRIGPRKKDLEDPVYAGDHCSGMTPPNHMVQFTQHELFPYPLMHAEIRTDNGNVPAFVDQRYGYDYLAYLEKPKMPPTWMDPQLLCEMALKDKRIVQVLLKAFKTNRRKPALKALPPLLDEIMSDKYLVYVLEEFAKRRQLLAEWLIGHFADRVLDRKTQEEMKKMKKLERLARKEKQG